MLWAMPDLPKWAAALIGAVALIVAWVLFGSACALIFVPVWLLLIPLLSGKHPCEERLLALMRRSSRPRRVAPSGPRLRRTLLTDAPIGDLPGNRSESRAPPRLRFV